MAVHVDQEKPDRDGGQGGRDDKEKAAREKSYLSNVHSLPI